MIRHCIVVAFDVVLVAVMIVVLVVVVLVVVVVVEVANVRIQYQQRDPKQYPLQKIVLFQNLGDVTHRAGSL